MRVIWGFATEEDRDMIDTLREELAARSTDEARDVLIDNWGNRFRCVRQLWGWERVDLPRNPAYDLGDLYAQLVAVLT